MRPYQFALLRYQHDLDAGEFANVGVVLYDAAERRLLVRVSERYKRLSDFFGDFNGSSYRSMLRHVERALLAADERLRQPDAFGSNATSLAEILAGVMPTEDSCLLASPVMSGVIDSPDGRLLELYEEFVARYEPREEGGRRHDDDVRHDVRRRLVRSPLHNSLKWAYDIQSANYHYEFEAGWQNGKPQVLEPISFDMAQPRSILDKANLWTGRLANLNRGADFAFSAVVAPPTEPRLANAFDQAMAMLRSAPTVREIVTEDHLDRLFDLIRRDMEAHPQHLT
jgi:hypothetical protein